MAFVVKTSAGSILTPICPKCGGSDFHLVDSGTFWESSEIVEITVETEKPDDPEVYGVEEWLLHDNEPELVTGETTREFPRFVGSHPRCRGCGMEWEPGCLKEFVAECCPGLCGDY